MKKLTKAGAMETAKQALDEMRKEHGGPKEAINQVIERDPVLALFTGVRFRALDDKWQAVAAVRAYVSEQTHKQADEFRGYVTSRMNEKDAIIGHLSQRIHRLSRVIRTINDQHAEALIEATSAEPPSLAMAITSEGKSKSRNLRDFQAEVANG